MSSNYSDENKSSSMTSESELRLFRKKLKEFKYPQMPKRNPELIKCYQKNNIVITTNLFELKFRYDYYRLTLFSISILPEVDKDNDPLRRKIYNKVDNYLPKNFFKKTFWAGQNFYAIINNTEGEKYENIEIKVEIDDVSYTLKLDKVKEISFRNVNDFNGGNQTIKSIIENLIRNIIMKNPKVIKFHDRTIFEIDPNNITNIKNTNNFYSGYLTSANITESGLYMLINNINKLITGKTVLTKMKEMRKNLSNVNMNKQEIFREIKDYFKYHRTVLTIYGSLRTYKILDIDFEKNPTNTSINYKDKDGRIKTIPLYNYYKIQYKIEIIDKNQPLIIADNNFLEKQKLLPSNNKNNSNENYIIYLIPELVYITGLEEEKLDKRHKNIVSSGFKDPNQKMEKIKGIFNLINSNDSKQIKNKKGEKVNLKSPKELSEEWGINLGSNLTFQGTIFPQPQLYFKNKNIFPNNGRFQTADPFKSHVITAKNIFYVYDNSEKNNYNHRQLFTEILKIFREKKFEFSGDFHPNKVKGIAIEDSHNWESIKRSLSKIERSNESRFCFIFASQRLEKFYNELKDFFLKQLNITTQHAITRKLVFPKKGRTMMYNLVDQINVKEGGENFHIDFKAENIIKSGQVFLIIGLDSKRSNSKITFSMTSSYNFLLTQFYTQAYTCEDKTQPKNETLMIMFEKTIEKLKQHSPHCPDYIIIYRQGGNDVQNKRLTINEIDNFKEVLKQYREKYKYGNDSCNFKNTKLYYICCSLKSDLKFFETKIDNRNNVIEYKNPPSGLIVDEKVTQSNKFEFYLQPQFVNQGTATPCHYQVMYYDKSQDEDDNLKIEYLEKLSFYLTYYYWTWSGAIRVPSFLKMSTTAMDFCRKVFGEQPCFFEQPKFI